MKGQALADREAVRDAHVMRGSPAPPEWRVTPDNVYRPPFTHWFMQHVREVERTCAVERREPVSPLPGERLHIDTMRVARGDTGSWTVADALSATYTDAFMLLHRGKVVAEQYSGGMKPESTHLWQSVSKSLGSCVAANLVERGLLDTETMVGTYVPELSESAYGDACVRDLLDMSVGVRFSEEYADDQAEIARLDRLYGARAPRSDDEPGSSYDFATEQVKEGSHGDIFHYVSLNLQVLGWVMERITGIPVPELISREVWGKLGTEDEAYIALDGAGSAQLEGGFCSSLRDFARFGQMLCQGGIFNGAQVVPASWIDDIATGGDEEAFSASSYKGLFPGGSYRGNYWVSRQDDHTAIMGRGIYGQFLYVNREAQVVAVKFSTRPVATDILLARHEFALAESLAVWLGQVEDRP